MLDLIDRAILKEVDKRGRNRPSISDLAVLFSEDRQYNAIRDRIYDLERQGFLETEKQRDRVLIGITKEGHVEARASEGIEPHA